MVEQENADPGAVVGKIAFAHGGDFPRRALVDRPRAEQRDAAQHVHRTGEL